MRAIHHCIKCGSVPEIIRVGDNKEYFTVHCPKCYWNPAPSNEATLTITGAIRFWNKACKK